MDEDLPCYQNGAVDRFLAVKGKEVDQEVVSLSSFRKALHCRLRPVGSPFLLIVVAYVVITIVMTYPVILQLDTHLITTGDDTWVHYWNGWWVGKALSEGGSIYATDLLFHPETTSLVYHNFAWLNIASWLLLKPILGGVAAFNLTNLINVTLCALTACLMMRHLVGSWGPAFITGLVHGYWPFRLTNYNHPNTISTQWLPLALLFTILLIREQRPKYVVLGGLCLALTGLSRWQMLLPAAVAIGVYLLFSLLFEWRSWSWRTTGMLGAMGLVTIVLIAVPVYPLMSGVVSGEFGSHQDQARLWTADGSTDLLAYAVPPAQHPLASLFSGLRYAHEVKRFGYAPSAFLGYTVIGLVMCAALWRWKAARVWIALGAVAFLLALGPILHLNAVRYPGVPMPYRLVGWMAPVRWMRAPRRFNILLALPVAVLAGYGASALEDKLVWRRASWFWGLLSVLLLFDYLNLPSAMVEAGVPQFYASIADSSDDFGIMGLPSLRDDTEYYMFYQTVHGHPLLAGHISRLPANAFSFISSVPLLDNIYQTGSIDTRAPDLSRQLSLLADAGFRYVVLHKELASRKQLTRWRSYLTISPRYEDDEVVVYPTEPVMGQDYVLRYRLTDKMGMVKAELSREQIVPAATLELDLAWGNTRPLKGHFQVEILLVGEDGHVGQSERFEVSPRWSPEEWPASAIARDHYALEIERGLAGGEYRVIVQLMRDAEPVGEHVTVGDVTLVGPEPNYTAPAMERRLDVTFGEVLELLGYDLREGEGTIQVTLHWQALRRMEVAYKFFVHLYDAESGDLIAQVDTMPQDWSYPTTWWEKGEVVSEDISLSLEGLRAGRYRLAVGVYVPDTGERLAVARVLAGLSSRDDSLMLPEVLERDVESIQ